MPLLRLISPVIGAIVASLVALSAIAILFANQMDINAIKSERRLLSDMVGKIPFNLQVVAEDNSWWDEAVDNMHLDENQDWMRATLGDTSNAIAGIDGVIIFRGDNSVLFSNSNNNPEPNLDSLMPNGLESTLSKLVPVDANIGVAAAGFLSGGRRVYAVGLSMVQPSGFKEYSPPLGNRRRPVVMFYREISEEESRELSNSLDLSNLEFVHLDQNDVAASTELNHTIFGLNGLPAGRFVWDPATPGANLLETMFWPAIFFLIVVLLAVWSFVHRARRLVDELEQADRVKNAFLASMSHEVRTPLNAIIGFAEIIRLELYGEIKGKKNKEYLDIIRSSGEHLLTVINDILNISKLDAGKMEVFAEAMDPVEVITESIKLMEPNAQDRSIRVVQELESSMIINDERIIRQILINLLSNAIKFTAPGGQVSVHSEITPSGYKFIVSDTGIGMSKEEIDVALEPFGQVGEAKKQVGGTGLGLPLVNRFAALIGAKMTIRSAPGHGTSVTIELPQAVSAKSEELPATSAIIS